MIKVLSILLALLAILSGFINIALVVLFYMMSGWGGSVSTSELVLMLTSIGLLGLSLYFAISGARNNNDGYKLTGAFMLISLAVVQVVLLVSGGLESML